MHAAVSHETTKTQYGFRPGMSTSHAIYIIRRIQDFAESKSSKLSLALLDWEKAFDKIQHDKLILALLLNISPLQYSCRNHSVNA